MNNSPMHTIIVIFIHRLFIKTHAYFKLKFTFYSYYCEYYYEYAHAYVMAKMIFSC